MIDPKEKPLYEAICEQIDNLLANGCALDCYWGLDQHGKKMNMPYDNDGRRIVMYSLHGAATVAAAMVVFEWFDVKNHYLNYVNRAHTLGESYYKRKWAPTDGDVHWPDELCRERGIDAKQLAKASGVEAKAIERILDRRWTTNQEHRKRVALVFDKRPEEVMWGYDNPV